MLGQMGEAGEKGVAPLDRVGYSGGFRRLEHGGCAERQQTDDRAYLEPLRAAVRQAQHVVEKSVLLVPQIVLTIAHPAERRADPHEMLKELYGQRLVDRIVRGQLDGDLKHRLGVERHPAGAVCLVHMAAGRQRRAAVENADIVEAEEAALEDVAPARVLAVAPPGEIDQ